MSNIPGNDDEVRRLLHDAVSDVQPQGSLDDIRSRTDKVVPMKRWFLPTLAVAAVMAAVVGGAFWLVNNDDPRTSSGPSGSPTHSTAPQTPGTSPSSDGAGTHAVPVYYVGDTAHGRKLFREFQSQEVCGDPVCIAKRAVSLALSGTPADPDYRTQWPTGVALHGFTATSDLITIDLLNDARDRPSGMSADDANLAVQQLVYSAQAGLGQGRLPVQFLIDGKHTDMVLGVPASEPLAADNADAVLSPVQVDTPAEGASVDGTFTVTGRASAFEANVVWELKQGDTVVKHGAATAQECCTLSPYSFDVTAPPGDYTLVVHDEDMSGQDRPVNQDTKEITVK